MATISPVPKLQFSDQNGAPLAGGLVYTYEAGTLNPRATYTTAAGITANPNPIVLDASGQADIFLQAGLGYKFVLQNSLATTIWTVDNVTAAGTMSLQNASSVNITGGTIGAGVTLNATVNVAAGNIVGAVAIANGGTGQTTAAAARGALAAAASGANTDITSVAADTTIRSHIIGFLNIPSNAKTGAYVVTAADAGHCIDITTGGVTIPANATLALAIGFTFSIYNNSGSSQTIAITTDTMRLAGSATTGTRTLAQRGWATARKVAATEWVITGAGIS
jgi:hypothetical protein